jgi:hypothetical protein
MAYDLDTQPGGWVLTQTRLREQRALIGFAIFFSALVGTMLLAIISALWAIMVMIVLLAGAFGLRSRAERYIDDVVNWRHGAEAERDVGELLNELTREHWTVMHDTTPTGRGNLDHIVSGPNGVYLVETKYRRYEQKQLGRVKHQARLLHDELGVWVTPVICLRNRRRGAFTASKVAIVPYDHLLDWLHAQRNRPVEFERLARFADKL